MSNPNGPPTSNLAPVTQRSAHSGSPPGARGLRLGNAPTVSIVVASVSKRPTLETCIERLLPVCAEAGIELVVVRSTNPEEFRDLQNCYRAVLFMPAPDSSPTKVLRSFGIAAAEGDIVALIDDSHLPDAEWLRHIVAITAPAATS